MIKKWPIFLIFILLSQKTFGLGIERELIFQILSTSSSKRTALFNKGEEDGLKVGDQAKLYNKKGQPFAYAVVRKVSPGRSLWSVFKILTTVPMHKGNVAKLKIIPPVKLSEDSSKLILGEPTVSSGKLEKIPVVKEKSKSKITKSRYLQNIPSNKNYSSLNDLLPEKRDPNIDWSRLDLDDFGYSSKLKIKKTKNKVDFGSLEEKPLTRKELQKRRDKFTRLYENKLIVPNSKEIEKDYSSLEDFSYY